MEKSVANSTNSYDKEGSTTQLVGSYHTWMEFRSTVPATAVVLPMSIVGFILINNVIILTVFYRMKKKLKYHHFYLIALAIGDLILAPPLFLTCYTMIAGGIRMTVYTCNTIGMMVIAPVTTTISIHCLMCMDKTVSILKPHIYQNFVSKRYSKVQIIAALVCCFVLPLLYISALSHANILVFHFEASVCTCLPIWTVLSYGAYGVLSVVGLTVEILSHILIFRKILRMPKSNRTKIMKATRTMLITVGAYYISWLPYSIMMLVQSFSRNDFLSKWVIYTVTNLLIMNSCINILIYICTLPGFSAHLMGPPRVGAG